MFNEDQKNQAARIVGLSDVRRTDLIRQRVREEKHPSDESAIFRKTLAHVMKILEKNFGETIAFSKFTEYNESVEKMISEVDASMKESEDV